MIPPRNTCIFRKHSQAFSRESFSDAISGAAVTFASALKGREKGQEQPTSVVRSGTSPGRSVELRMKNYEQLRYLQQLYDDGILTGEEYQEQKQLIITSICKL